MFDGKVGSLNKRKVSLRGKSGREGSAKDAVCDCVYYALLLSVGRRRYLLYGFFFFISLWFISYSSHYAHGAQLICSSSECVS